MLCLFFICNPYMLKCLMSSLIARRNEDGLQPLGGRCCRQINVQGPSYSFNNQTYVSSSVFYRMQALLIYDKSKCKEDKLLSVWDIHSVDLLQITDQWCLVLADITFISYQFFWSGHLPCSSDVLSRPWYCCSLVRDPSTFFLLTLSQTVLLTSWWCCHQFPHV